MTDLDIPKTYAHQRIHLLADRRHRLEELLSILNRHIQHIGNRLALELDLERFTIVPRTLARLARHIHVRQKVHLDLDDAIALTGFTTSTLHVEREPPRLISARLCLRQPRKPVANRRKGPGISRRVRTRRPTNRALIDVDHLIQMLKPLDRLARRRRLPCPIQPHGRGFEQGLNRQRRLPAAGHPCHADKLAQRKLGRHILQVVPRRVHDLNNLLVTLTPFRRHRDLSPTGKVIARDALFVRHHLRWRPMGHNSPTVHTSPGPNVKDVIRLADRLFIVFHHDHRIALISQAFQRRQQAIVVPLVQPYRRLIKHIQNALQATPDLAGEPNPLALPA